MNTKAILTSALITGLLVASSAHAGRVGDLTDYPSKSVTNEKVLVKKVVYKKAAPSVKASTKASTWDLFPSSHR